MSRWHVPTELSVREQKLAGRIRRHSRFFLFLREIRAELFDGAFQTELLAAYKPRGQEPVPPALLAMVTLLQAYTGSSDAEAVDAAEMDLRWQLVLGTVGEAKARFGQGSLVRFRSRMVENDFDQRLVDRTVELAKKTGKFGWQKLRVALDSSPLRGSGRVEDTWNLIGRAMSKLVAVLAAITQVPEEQIVKEARLTILSGPSVKTSLDIDWDDAHQRLQALQRVLGEAESLLAWTHEHASAAVEQTKARGAIELLMRVMTQDIEPDPNKPGMRRIRQGVAKDRVCSVGDPQMRHGRKSQSKLFNGYKRHVAVTLDAPLILAAVALPANQPEFEATSALLDVVRKHGSVGELFIDRGYLAADEVTTLSRQSIPVRCRPWPIVAKPGMFAKSDFHIDLRTCTVRCPAGHTAAYSRSGSAERLTARFADELCARCKLRTRCAHGAHGRAVRVHPQESLLRKLRACTRSSRGRSKLRERVAVEHRLGRIQVLQGDRARYVGQRLNTLDLRRHAAIANLVYLQPILAA